jgi:hypothetical protein
LVVVGPAAGASVAVEVVSAAVAVVVEVVSVALAVEAAEAVDVAAAVLAERDQAGRGAMKQAGVAA